MPDSLLISNPWIDGLREAERFQPLLSSQEYVRVLRHTWAQGGRAPEHLLRTPLVQRHPIARTLAFLLAKRWALSVPPFIPTSSFMPLFELCQLALLWAIAGEEEQARTLAQQLLPLISFPALWCKEEDFQEEEARLSLALLKKSLGCPDIDLRGVEEDPYFSALAEQLPQWENVPVSQSTYALSLTGEGTSLGAFCAEGVEVRAFGPQSAPLNQPRGFGILRERDEEELLQQGWTSLFAYPEIWMELLDSSYKEGQLQLAVRFLGLEKISLFFSFYVKATHCEIGRERLLLQQRSLQRYQGIAKPLLFDNKLQIASLLPTKMEVIPLAGEGGFWNCDYLVAFEISPFESRGHYRIS